MKGCGRSLKTEGRKKNDGSSKFPVEMPKKKNVVTAAIVLVSILALPVYAEGAGGRRGGLKSEGIIEYADGEHGVLIDSGDLYYLADEIDSLETAAKWGTLQAIQALPDAAASAGLAGKTAADIPNITFSALNGAIRSSQQSASAPAAAEILSGKTAWANGRKITGSMRNNGATGASNLIAGRSYSIPAGYTTGGTVTTASLASQTAATAAAANISSGKTAWVNGQLVTGTGADNNSSYEQGRAAGYEQGRSESQVTIVDLGEFASGGSVASICSNYRNLTERNFIIQVNALCFRMYTPNSENFDGNEEINVTKTYDASTGKLYYTVPSIAKRHDYYEGTLTG